MRILLVLFATALLTACSSKVPDWGVEGPTFYPNDPGGAQSTACREYDYCVGAYRK